MSEYEFWDELGNIFNAIVAYQHKTIEFNKRFVNPWLRLGTVFDQNDHNADALLAHKKAIEIDKENGSNWLSLGDVYFKMGSFDDAEGAYAKAIELNPKLGWAYANLAMVNATRQKYSEAVNLYVKSLEIIEDEKDRSMIWNRLGNVYRKVNDYENAFIAFQMADECDGQNTGFTDQLDEVTVEQRVMPIVAEVYVNNNSLYATEAKPAVVEEPAQPAEEPVIETAVWSPEQEIRPATDDAIVSEVSDIVVEETPPITDMKSEVETPLVEESATMVEIDAQALAAEQESDVAVPVAEAPAEEETVSEETVKEVVAEQPVEKPAVVEVVENAATLSVTAEVEESFSEGVVVKDDISEGMTETSVAGALSEEDVTEPVVEVSVEDVVAEVSQAQAVVETAVEATPCEDSQPEAVVEVSIADALSEEAQFEVGNESPADVTPSADTQPEIVSETPAVDIVIEEVQMEVVAGSSEGEALGESGQPDKVTEESVAEAVNEAARSTDEPSVVGLVSEDVSADTTVAFMMAQAVETFADPSALNQPVVLVIDDLADLIRQPAPEVEVVAAAQDVEAEAQLEVKAEAVDEVTEPVVEAELTSESVASDCDVADVVAEIVALVNAKDTEVVDDEVQPETLTVVEEIPAAELEPVASVETTEITDIDAIQPEAGNESIADEDKEPAYEEFLKEAVDLVVASTEKVDTTYSRPSVKGELKVELDTKNAHVWNELGNVYFNTGAFEEAIAAYGKAIELDDWFAWPYSNLALVYVQKEKYAEAILLYQRSIELFTSDNEKAITWNRLGNVYRRLNDYDNAIACYQRADELDPNNATRSLRSRFSLLGSLNIEQSSSLAV